MDKLIKSSCHSEKYFLTDIFGKNKGYFHGNHSDVISFCLFNDKAFMNIIAEMVKIFVSEVIVCPYIHTDNVPYNTS